MTKIKMCGIMSLKDADVLNEIMPEYVGFVFAKQSRRYISEKTACMLRKRLNTNIKTVGVFVNENPKNIANYCKKNIIDIVQLHGDEDDEYIKRLRFLIDNKIIKAFSIDSANDCTAAQNSTADYVLLDNGKGGTGKAFDWSLLSEINRDYFLAGGLNPDNVSNAVSMLHPFAVDVSTGIETNSIKDENKMRRFACAVKGE